MYLCWDNVVDLVHGFLFPDFRQYHSNECQIPTLSHNVLLTADHPYTVNVRFELPLLSGFRRNFVVKRDHYVQDIFQRSFCIVQCTKGVYGAIRARSP